MSDTTEVDIVTGLNQHLSVSGIGIPIAFPNVDFEQPQDGLFARVSFQPNEVSTLTVAPGQYNHIGLYQITVSTPVGVGEIKAIEIASKIRKHFDFGVNIQTPSGIILIYSRPSVRPGMKAGGSYEVPVTILYQLISN